jgi:hypothetical protein
MEIQHGSLSASRDKVPDVLRDHRVLVAKPIVVRKRLVKRDAKGGRVISRRLSPRCGRDIDLFHELIFFTRGLPHRSLCIETPLVDVEEWRYPDHGRRRWRCSTDDVVEDRRLVALHRVVRFHSASDWMQIIPDDLPSPYHTAHVAERLNIQRSVAQQIAHCLRETGGAIHVGTKGNARLHQRCA